MKNKKVSIVIPTHNRADMVQRAINSLLNQTYENIEIILVDDGSTDNTQEVLQSYNDKRIVILKNETPKGACNARNKGIFAASGEFITFLDDDDEFLPTRIEKMLNAWNDKWAYIATGMYYIANNGMVLKKVPSKIISLNDILFKNTIGIAALTKKERLVSLNGFDEMLMSSQDYDMWVRLNNVYGDAFTIQEPLFIMHTEHEKPRITTSSNKVKGHFDFYKKHKHLMNVNQRKYKLYELYINKRKKISLLRAFGLGKKINKITVLKTYLNLNYPEKVKLVKSIINKKHSNKI